METIALQSLQIWYTFVLNAEIATGRTQYKSIQNFQTLEDYIFHILQHFAIKISNFTNISLLYPGIHFFC
jgi:hypothetical protein